MSPHGDHGQGVRGTQRLRKVALAISLLATLGAASILRAQPASAPATLDLGEYGPMADFVKPTDDQLASLAAKIADKRQALANFMKIYGPFWQAAMDKAAKAPDPGVRAAAQAQNRQFQEQYDRLLAVEEARIMSALSPGQRLAWERESLTQKMVAHFTRIVIGHAPDGSLTAQRFPLTDEQMKYIKTLCDQAAKDLQAMPDPYDPPARNGVIDGLVMQIEKKVPPGSGPGSVEK